MTEPDESSPPLDLADIQGTIIRGYRVEYSRHFILRVVEPAAARAFLGSLVSGSPSVPQITTAVDWGDETPDSFLNVGITCTGLERLGLEREYLDSFPASFKRGATDPDTKDRVGDVGDSDSAHWIDALKDAGAVNVILSLWVRKSEQVRDDVSAALRGAFAGALEELDARDAATFLRPNHKKVHFGYTDSLSQPLLAGAPAPKHQPEGAPCIQPVPIGEFLLGHPLGRPRRRVKPDALSTNSSFAAFRMLEQDVTGFEQFLDLCSAEAGIDRELLAAKICGRWRNGVPLVHSPDTPDPAPALRKEQLNDFDYGEDILGEKCPIGSHIRRTHPRSQEVRGGPGTGHAHRIIRRGMPYGPPYNADEPDDKKPRGLIGYFINADFRHQFEFIMTGWVNTPGFLMSKPTDRGNPFHLISGQDVLAGVNDSQSSSFTLPVHVAPDRPPAIRELSGFSRFVRTRGGAYVYLPSITALRYLARLGS